MNWCRCGVLEEVKFYSKGKPRCNICGKLVGLDKLRDYVSNMPKEEWDKLFDERNRGKEFIITKGGE